MLSEIELCVDKVFISCESVVKALKNPGRYIVLDSGELKESFGDVDDDALIYEEGVVKYCRHDEFVGGTDRDRVCYYLTDEEIKRCLQEKVTGYEQD